MKKRQTSSQTIKKIYRSPIAVATMAYAVFATGILAHDIPEVSDFHGGMDYFRSVELVENNMSHGRNSSPDAGVGSERLSLFAGDDLNPNFGSVAPISPWPSTDKTACAHFVGDIHDPSGLHPHMPIGQIGNGFMSRPFGKFLD